MKYMASLMGILLAGCGHDQIGPTETIKSESSVVLAASCGANPTDPHEMESGSALVGGDYGETFCAEMSSVLTFESGKSRVHLRADGGATIQLSCVAPESHAEFYSRHLGQKSALVAGQKVLGIYQISRPIEGLSCGRLEFSSLESALDFCEAITNAWGLDESACLNFCKGDEGVCVSKSPAGTFP